MGTAWRLLLLLPGDHVVDIELAVAGLGLVVVDRVDVVDLADDDDVGVARAGVGGRRLSLSPLNAIEYSELPTSK